MSFFDYTSKKGGSARERRGITLNRKKSKTETCPTKFQKQSKRRTSSESNKLYPDYIDQIADEQQHAAQKKDRNEVDLDDTSFSFLSTDMALTNTNTSLTIQLDNCRSPPLTDEPAKKPTFDGGSMKPRQKRAGRHYKGKGQRRHRSDLSDSLANLSRSRNDVEAYNPFPNKSPNPTRKTNPLKEQVGTLEFRKANSLSRTGSQKCRKKTATPVKVGEGVPYDNRRQGTQDSSSSRNTHSNESQSYYNKFLCLATKNDYKGFPRLETNENGDIAWSGKRKKSIYGRSNNATAKPQVESSLSANYSPPPVTSDRSTGRTTQRGGNRRSKESLLFASDHSIERTKRGRNSRHKEDSDNEIEPNVIDIISSESEDDEEKILLDCNDDTRGKRLSKYTSEGHPLSKVIVGKETYSGDKCFATFGKSPQPKLELKISSERKEDIILRLKEDMVGKIKYFTTEGNDISCSAKGSYSGCFVVINARPSSENKLPCVPNGDDDPLCVIVLEFRRLIKKSDILGPLDLIVDVDQNKVQSIIDALSSEEKNDLNRRLSSGSRPRTRSGRQSSFSVDEDAKEDILVVYPFPVDVAKLNTAIAGLRELSELESENFMDATKNNLSSSCPDREKEAKKKKTLGRTHYLTICNEDKERLSPGEYLNDTLIDFWMRWISRNEEPFTSNVHFFSSHFFTTLQDDGAAAVTTWTSKKKIDVFQKRFVFVPINASLHWSLCVVVNPGNIMSMYREKCNPSDEFPCILFMDSLKAHRKTRVSKVVRDWLNSEWKRLNKGKEQVFDIETMKVYDPRIPYQDNSWDCGVFVCRYAFALYQMRERPLLFKDVLGHNGRSFSLDEVISNSPYFNFGMENIEVWREEMLVLLSRLEQLYAKYKSKESRKKKGDSSTNSSDVRTS